VSTRQAASGHQRHLLREQMVDRIGALFFRRQ
jgi:hypothetical protein